MPWVKEDSILTQLPVVANLNNPLALPTSHVETVVRLDKKKPKEYVEIGVDAEDYYKIKDSEEAR